MYMGLLNTARRQQELEELYKSLYADAPSFQAMPATSTSITSNGSRLTMDAMRQYINETMGMPDMGMSETIKDSPVLGQLLEELI